MNESCTNFIPIEFEYLGKTHEAYLDAALNIIRPVAGDQSCVSSRNTPVYLDDTVWLYNPDGQLKAAEGIAPLDMSGYHLEAPEFEVSKIIYRTVTMLNWKDFREHHSLNEVYSVASAQRRVLEAMGMSMIGDPEQTATENIENLFQRGYWGFLLGNHVGSPFEIWTFLVCVTVTVWTAKMTICFVLKCRKAGCRSFMDTIRMRSQTVAQISWKEVEKQKKQMEVAESEMEQGEPERERMLIEEEDMTDLKRLYPRIASLLRDKVSTVNGNYYLPFMLGRRCEGLLDSGSSISLISARVFKKLGMDMKPIRVRATSVTGHQLNLIGQLDVEIEVGGKRLRHRFGVLEGNATEDVLLGSDFLARIGPVILDLEKGKLLIPEGNKTISINLVNSSQ
jgi:predicted aspartyl protease